MIVKELINALNMIDEDDMVLYRGIDGGWSNIELKLSDNMVYIRPSTNTIFSDD